MDKHAKQVIVMRADLGMRKGKMIAQGSHASLGVILGMMRNYDPSTDSDNYSQYTTMAELESYMEKRLTIDKLSPLDEWINGIFTKICVRVDSEEELLKIESEAKDAGLPVKLITDSGLTEFNGVPTNTCLAIGPAWSDDIDKITGNLKLL